VSKPVERMCVVTRERHPQDELVRLVLAPDGSLAVDYRARLPGRGAWVLPRRETIEKLQKHPGMLTRHLGPNLDASGLLERVRAANLAATLDALTLAMRAGVLVGGKDGVRGAISSDKALAVVLASDCSPRLAEDLRRRAEPKLVVELPLGSNDLGARIGKGARASLAVLRSKPGRKLLRELHRIDSLS
jgi:predicted RNA-binding protein YlxR (DUF448 family)/ribosomal protein L7Ae-like RNA K-turn-binding protein